MRVTSGHKLGGIIAPYKAIILFFFFTNMCHKYHGTFLSISSQIENLIVQISLK